MNGANVLFVHVVSVDFDFFQSCKLSRKQIWPRKEGTVPTGNLDRFDAEQPPAGSPRPSRVEGPVFGTNDGLAGHGGPFLKRWCFRSQAARGLRAQVPDGLFGERP